MNEGTTDGAFPEPRILVPVCWIAGVHGTGKARNRLE